MDLTKIQVTRAKEQAESYIIPIACTPAWIYHLFSDLEKKNQDLYSDCNAIKRGDGGGQEEELGSWHLPNDSITILVRSLFLPKYLLQIS